MRALVLPVAMLGLAAGLVGAQPAAATPLPVPDALAELHVAVDASNAAPEYSYRNNQLGWTAKYRAAGSYQEVTTEEVRIFEGVGNFHRISWTPRVRDKVRGYLDVPDLGWELSTDLLPYEFEQWIDIQSWRMDRLNDIANERFVTSADKTAHGDATVYTLAGEAFEYKYTVVDGLVTRRETTRGAGKPVEGDFETWDYGPVEIEQPGADAFRPIATVRRAIEAATLNRTIREIVRSVRRKARNRSLTPDRVRTRARQKVFSANVIGEGNVDEPIERSVRLKTRTLPNGVKVYSRNPYTGTVHAWAVVSGNSGWRTKKMAP